MKEWEEISFNKLRIIFLNEHLIHRSYWNVESQKTHHQVFKVFKFKIFVCSSIVSGMIQLLTVVSFLPTERNAGVETT